MLFSRVSIPELSLLCSLAESLNSQKKIIHPFQKQYKILRYFIHYLIYNFYPKSNPDKILKLSKIGTSPRYFRRGANFDNFKLYFCDNSGDGIEITQNTLAAQSHDNPTKQNKNP